MAKKQGKIAVHTPNLLPIIKKWLYSEHDIFLRELVSNASDAISKLKHLALMGEFTGTEPDYKIEITLNKEAKTLTIKDNGLGLTEEEVEKYISQVAFSGAQDFVQKYEKVKDSNDLIGFFGLGFFSAFMVANTVEIRSLSYQKNAKAVFWKSQGNETFEIDDCDKSTIGTEITLFLNEESEIFLNEDTVSSVVKKYSQFFATPIFVNEKQIEQQEPLWRKNSNEITDEDYKKLYKTLFPEKMADPIFYFHIKTDFPFDVRGIFYFPKIMPQIDPSNGNIKLFVKDVFVGEGLKEIVPEFLSPLLGVIESPDIPLNVSRSQLQGDIRIRKIASHIETKFAERFIALFKEDRKKLEEIWRDINLFIKFGCIREESFYTKIKDYLLLETAEGTFATIKEYLEQNPNLPEKNGKKLIFYMDDKKSLSSYSDLLEEHRITPILINPAFDSHFLGFVEQKESNVQFARVDSEMNELFYNAEKSVSKEDADSLIDTFKALVGEEMLIIEVKELKDTNLSATLVTNEQMRRFEEMSAMMNQGIMHGSALIGKTIVLNANNSIIKKIKELDSTNKEKATLLAKQVLDIALLRSNLLTEERKKDFIARSSLLLSELS